MTEPGANLIQTAIDDVVQRKDLKFGEMAEVFNEIMSGGATYAQIAAFVTALRMKGETVDEITAAVTVMRAKSLKVETNPNDVIIDTCGTGGSGKNEYNVSTVCALIAAGCGVKVAKHGNRSVSSRCGSADVLEKLGVNININPVVARKLLKDIGIVFLFAPVYHNAMRFAAGVRKEIGIRTIFNMLGPLCNPAGVRRQIVGVYDRHIVLKYINVMRQLDYVKAFVISSDDGLDEISISGRTMITELRNKRIRTFSVNPRDFGFKKSGIKTITGGTADQNADIIMRILNGEKGPKRDIAVINAAYALIVADKARDIEEGVRMAEEAIDSKKAVVKLNELIKHSNIT